MPKTTQPTDQYLFCDFGHEAAELRILPFANGNLNVCHRHYTREIKERKTMIKLGIWSADTVDLTKWEDLKVYQP